MSGNQGKSNHSEWEYLDRLLTECEAAAFIPYTPKALQKWRYEGGGPSFVRVSSRSIRYRRRELIACTAMASCVNGRAPFWRS